MKLKLFAAFMVISAGILGGVVNAPSVNAESNNPKLDLKLNVGSTTTFKYMPWYIYVKSGEKAVAEFTVSDASASADLIKGTFTLTSPDGSVKTVSVDNKSFGLPGDAQGKPSSVKLESEVATKPGVYMVTAQANSGTDMSDSFGVDWSIGATTTDVSGIVSGRVWSEYYRIHYQSGNRVVDDLKLYYVGKDGAQYESHYYDFNGFTSIFKVSSLGMGDKNCVPVYQSKEFSSRITDGLAKDNGAVKAECGDIYKIFYEKPDSAMPSSVTLPNGESTWLINPYLETVISDLSFESQASEETPAKGVFTGKVKNYNGLLKLYVDVNNDGDYSDKVDRIIEVVNDSEDVSIDFDGLDGEGNPIAEDTDINFELKAENKGEIHFSRNDVEQNTGGMYVKRLNGSTYKNTWLFWDDSNLYSEVCGGRSISPIDNSVNGVDSTGGVHGWTYKAGGQYEACSSDEMYNSWGDNRIIEDWTYDLDSARSDGYKYHIQKIKKDVAETPETTQPQAPNTGSHSDNKIIFSVIASFAGIVAIAGTRFIVKK